jgi:hypothetical protein
VAAWAFSAARRKASCEMSADSIRALAEGQVRLVAFIVQMTFKDLGLALAEAERAADAVCECRA